MLFRSTETPNIQIFIRNATTGAPVSGLTGGQACFIKPDGDVSNTTGLLVELDTDRCKGWYSVQVVEDDDLDVGNWMMVYQTPTTFANVGQTEFTVNAPVVDASFLFQNEEVSVFPFQMVNATSGLPMTGLTPEVKRSLDGGGFGFGDLGAPQEIGEGWYYCSMGPNDSDGSIVIIKATADGAKPSSSVIITHPRS